MYPPTKKVPEGRRKKAVAKLFYTLTENNHKLYIFICSQMVFFLRPCGTWKSFYQYPPGLKPGAWFQRPDGAFLFSVMIFHSYRLFMEIWQNHFFKNPFFHAQTWQKYLFFEKLRDNCENFSIKKEKYYIFSCFFTTVLWSQSSDLQGHKEYPQ